MRKLAGKRKKWGSMMGKVRKAAVAGTFYPADAAELARMVDDFMADAKGNGGVPKAVIAPHAGYIYSGPIAGSAYARLSVDKQQIKQVVIMGPAHRVALQGLAASSADVFATPLGNVAVDQEAIKSVLDLPQVVIRDEAHATEHSLEVHLPFLQRLLTDFSIVPLVVGQASEEEVAEVLSHLWGGPETAVIISSDLSHFHDYQTAQQLDRATAQAIVNLEARALGYDSACGRIPIRGLLHIAKEKGLQAQVVDLRNSGDTSGSRGRVVGYGAFIFA